MDTYRFIIMGKVQGVFYRKSIQQMASLGGLQGYVKNLDDGSVEVVVNLYEDQLQEFMMVLKNGSPMSEVKEVAYEIIELDEDELAYDGFSIR
jgi:acylphosphatase